MEGYWNYTEVVIQENTCLLPTWWLITPHMSSVGIWLNDSWLFLDNYSSLSFSCRIQCWSPLRFVPIRRNNYSSLWFSCRIQCWSPLRFVPIRKNLRKNVVLSNLLNAKNTSLSDRSHLKWVVAPTSVPRKSFILWLNRNGKYRIMIFSEILFILFPYVFFPKLLNEYHNWKQKHLFVDKMEKVLETKDVNHPSHQ